MFARGCSQRLAKLAGELSYNGCDDDLYFVAHAKLYANEKVEGLRDLTAASMSLPEVAAQSQ
ncbi:hypothetical protein ILFOPFJJ_05595 [Ensifer psoraleae]|uniref:hypothetical protein n=1 Tax=Sinorhizobium psoraleae TaxID=520838 RepID=UPI0015683073|nr:hypothetical protein [Sinorhizobium psoraleae]NRP74673.1 hypothetical protein [Sinorhizobium psoraleae]